MAADSDAEKTEAATPRRITKARQEGQVPRSRELGTCLILFGGLATLWAGGHALWTNLIRVMRGCFDLAPAMAHDPTKMSQALIASLKLAGWSIAPILIVSAVLGTYAALALGGWLFTFDALAPKFSRLDPISGMARFASVQTAVELAKTMGKALLIGALGYWVLMKYLPQMVQLSTLGLAGAIEQGIGLTLTCCLVAMTPLILIALIDAPWQKHSYAKRLRMTKEEVRQEYKEDEGDPHVKGRIRQQQREISRRRMMAEVPKANVVVTNPTHFAVAIRYEDGQPAPKVVAKGRGAIAAKIRDLAAENGVPLIEAPPLARALYTHVELEATIPPALYSAVAQVLAWVYQLRRWEAGLEAQAPSLPRTAALAIPQELDPGSPDEKAPDSRIG